MKLSKLHALIDMVIVDGLLLLLLLSSCLKTEIINAPEYRGIDTVFVKTNKTYIDTTNMNMSDITDTTDQRVPIEFDPTVEDWDEENNIDI